VEGGAEAGKIKLIIIMDISVAASAASAGSFFVSERVLKPKATLFGVFGCVLLWDLSTFRTNAGGDDLGNISKAGLSASFRVYRGTLRLR